MSKRALLLKEVAQLDADKLAVHEAISQPSPTYTHGPEIHQSINADRDEHKSVYMATLEQVNSFRRRLCVLLGITHQPIGMYDSALLLGYLETTEPVIGGDVGVSTRIEYGSDHYKVRMALGSMDIEVSATNTEELLVVISRGYTCLRILSKGTRYYHSR